MQEQVNIVTSIEGLGTVEVKHNLISFSLTLKAKGESLEDAKTQVRGRTSEVLKELEAFKMDLEGEIVTQTSNYKLEHREGSEKFPAGYQSVSNISWTCAVDTNLNEIYRFCLKTDKDMSAPMFSVKNRETLLEQAREKAIRNVQSKLNKECSLLNVDASTLRIHNWHVGYDGFIPAVVYAGMPQNGLPGAYTNSVSGSSNNFRLEGTPAVAYGAAIQAPQKLGSIYQELLDAKLIPGTVAISVAVQVNYVRA